ncbi:MAG TPA: hypothetical protein DCQ98_19560 [Planctomycetaceae bacterium]|nr:hypothetical protein [Planctomycetaceae bacterium]HRF00828.1 hypothetical protein [Pirellulaceae bacterium]
MPGVVSLSDLEEALAWVSGPPEFGSSAFVSRSTGKIYLRSLDGGVDEDFPDDIEDATEYVPVPHKNDLDLGRELVLAFIESVAPDLHEQVRVIFRKRGAYSVFKGLLQRQGLLERWHDYERSATQRALERWALENGLTVAPEHDA